ncbi:MAG: Lrp/AsnC ligand binding domain-containing protein [Candidatus Bathyarchaeia archaeon]
MPRAIILINAEAGTETELATRIKGLPYVQEVYLLYGAYDILVRVDVQEMNRLSQVVLQQLRPLPGVRSTVTLVVMDEV